ncbi:MAG: hypothetical protein PHU08_07370 [Dehalococcoidales bacterium]|nr:hypothetical protein [Dehalococcoidales bacterium]
MPKLTKSFYERREELKESLYRLSGALERYKKTREYAELGTVAIELRGLLLGEALLLSLADEKGFPLEMFTIPVDLKTLLYGEKNCSVWLGDGVSLRNEKPWIHRITVKDWLGTTIVIIDNSRYSVERLLTEIVNNLGPAHYSKQQVSRGLVEMRQYKFAGKPSHFATLLNFADVLLELGKRFIATY